MMRLVSCCRACCSASPSSAAAQTTLAGRRSEGQFAGRDGSGRRAEGCSLQDRVEGVSRRARRCWKRSARARSKPVWSATRRSRSAAAANVPVKAIAAVQPAAGWTRGAGAEATRRSESFDDLKRQEDRHRPRFDRPSADPCRAGGEGMDSQTMSRSRSSRHRMPRSPTRKARSTRGRPGSPMSARKRCCSSPAAVITAEGLTPGLGFQVATPTAIRDKRPELEDFVRRLTAARAWSAEQRQQLMPRPGAS